MSDDLASLRAKAQRALQNGDTLVALMQLEAIYQHDPSPSVKSALAYCLAKERRQFQKAMALCRDALTAEPTNPEHYLQLGRIYLAADQKRQAISAFRKGLKIRRHQPIIRELAALGLRQQPVFATLPREHFLNRTLGRLLTRFGAR